MKAAAPSTDGRSKVGVNAAPRRARVWIVDDSPLEAEAARRALASECDTEIFTDGSAVLERGAHAPLPDVLVLDWVMPGISGLEVCRFLRAKHDQLPVLLLTVNRATEHLIEGLEAGANDFVPKPFAAPELAARVRALFQTRLLRERIEQGEHERVEAERHRADAAEERARMNELYLAAIGHDLRNPVSAIAMTARVIDSQTKDEHVRKLARNIETASRQMFEMLGALLDVTRMRLGGGIAIEPRRDSLGRLCRQVVDELSVVHPHRQLLLELPDDGSDELEFDFARMNQVVSNLVTNALIHGSRDTPVRIDVTRVGVETQLRVHNQGRALSAESRAHLFDPFRRGTIPNGGPPGLGLGLYIAQQIVTAHGGSISVSSGDVTTFTVHLPAPR